MPELTDAQRKEIAEWVAQGDNLSLIQKKLQEQFQIQMTYMDVRFLVDDLQLELQDPVAPVEQAEDPAMPNPPESSDQSGNLQDETGAPSGDEIPPASGSVSVTVDPVSLNPAAIASGSVQFSDGVTAKWMVDQQGRPGLTDVSQPGYRPTQADAEAFMTQLATALHEKGF